MGWDERPYDDDAAYDGDGFDREFSHDFDDDFVDDYPVDEVVDYDDDFDSGYDGGYDADQGAGYTDTPPVAPPPENIPSKTRARRKKSSPTRSRRLPGLNRLRQYLGWGIGVLALIVLAALGFAAIDRLLGDDSGDAPMTLPTEDVHAGTLPPGSDWPENVAAVPHTVPAMIKNNLAVEGAQHGYAFDGQAGARWSISVAAQADTLDPALDLYGPDGMLLASADDQSAQNLDAALAITLPSTGTYRVLVRSSRGGTTVGNYLLTLWNVD